MKSNPKVNLYVCKIVPAVILLILFFLPIGMQSLNLAAPANAEASTKPLLFWTFKLPFYSLFATSFFHYCFYLVYLMPAVAAFLLISLFIKKDLKKPVFLSVYVALSIYLICSFICFISTANAPSWFKKLPLYIHLFYFISITSHIFMTVYGSIQLKNSNPQYVEFKKIHQEEKDQNGKKLSIKTKLNVTVLSTITIILFTFMALVLNRYKDFMTEAVSDIGRSIAEQAASVYVENEGLNTPIAEFFQAQKTNNSYAGSPYERIDIIKITYDKLKELSNEGNNLFIEEINSAADLPDFEEFAYTTGNPADIPAEQKVLSAAQAYEFLKRYKNGSYRRQPYYDKATNTCKFFHPVAYEWKKGHHLVAFSIVTYNKELLMEALFKTKIFVLSMTILFLYISVIVSVILSDLIVNPLLFLKLNVRKASDSISDVLSGSAKVETKSLVFEDTIKTKDEVKDLSKEISNLVQLIRGIIPYISFSTLKNAEKTDSRKSTARELCFLFTDIRGFTTLCEGLQPKEVVGILNHYLDIETEIILNNGGDVDKFVGDEMMAFFAGPRKEYNACKAAMEIRAAMRAEQQKSKEDGKSFISIGIGINTGKVVFGPVGSRTRMDFTSIGDTVNLASRLESANKAYGSKSIITEAVYSKLHDSFICRELDFITVKGKTEPCRIYEILQKKTVSADKIYEIKDLFEKGLALYREQKWPEAEKYFNECAVKYRDYPSIVFMDRIRHFKQNPPPADWDGVFAMKVK